MTHQLRMGALGLASIVACSGGDDATWIGGELPPPSQAVFSSQDDFFSLDHLVEIEVEIDPLDWDVLRREGRHIVGAYTRTQSDFEYTTFDATVSIDGQRYSNVAVRKKGYWGSLSTIRPSLKINLAPDGVQRNHLGIERLTLNNDRTDTSHTHTCMTYRLFQRADLPAPRCNLAHVVVNGQDLGTYTHVETVDDLMLKRSFGNSSGNLYEGQLADFVRADIDYIELDNNEDVSDRSDLYDLVDALEVPDDELVERLGQIVDLDRFRDFWAMELLTEHWDGYTNNANNYLAYHDPASDRFVFIPWGADSAFDGGAANRAFANGRIANRLYHIPEERDRLRQRLGELNDALWDSERLLAEVDLIAELAPSSEAEALERQRALIRRRRGALRSALTGPAPAWRNRRSPCWATFGPISGSFATHWGSIATMGPDSGTFDARVTLDGQEHTAVSWTGGAGVDLASGTSQPTIRFAGTLTGGRRIEFDLRVETTRFEPGVIEFHGSETTGILYTRNGKRLAFIGGIGNGAIELDQARAVAGAEVTGSFRGDVLQLGCSGL